MTYRKGARFEYEIAKKLKDEGYTVLRSAGSHGNWDLVAYKDQKYRLIQAKCVASGYVDPKERMKLKSARVPANSTKELWVKSKKGINITVI